VIRRVAGNSFWMARYLERAENNARLLRMAEGHSLSPEGNVDTVGLYTTALEVGGTLDSYEERIGEIKREDVIRFMVLDRENFSGIVSCFRLARENGRTCRHLITDFYWDALNETWLEAQSLDEEAIAVMGVDGVVRWAIKRARLVRGAAEDLLRDTLPHVLALGEAVERADFTARILAEMLPPLLARGTGSPPIGSPLCRRWRSLLSGLGLTETWRREYGGRIVPLDVLALALLHPTSPHSLLVNIERMSAAIDGFAGPAPGDSKARKTAVRLESMLRKADLEALSRKGMRDFVDGMSTTTNALGLAVLGEYFE
jgi:uncharacterized alpha-E superfamily protein